MTNPKRALILTADAGFGHRSAANAIAAAFEQNYKDEIEPLVINPLEDRLAPAFLRETQADYDKLVRKMPDFYKLNYQISDSAVPAIVLESALTVLLFVVIRKLLKKLQPDVVLTTHPFYMAPLNTCIVLSKLSIPFLTVITDLTDIHRLWFNQGSDLICLPTKEAEEDARSAGILPAACRVTGIPVNPIFARDFPDRKRLRSELGWAPDVTTALVIGSARIHNLMPVLNLINHAGFLLQLILVAGGDKKLFNDLMSVEWHTAVHIYNYVDQMPNFMRSADFIISKAGGLTLTEALASGLPVLMVDVTPGQEEGNARYLVKHGAGEHAKTPVAALETICHWMANDQKLLAEYARRAGELGVPGSALQVASLGLKAASRGRTVQHSRLASWAARSRELLSTFGVSTTED